MLTWLLVVSVAFNFTYGALLPVIPRLNVETAGAAFTAFSLFKVGCLAPAGRLSDRIGHARALTLALALQVAGLLTIGALPEWPWLGRILEGIALAQGTVSAVSMLREVSPRLQDFEKGVNRLMGIGGLGFLLGPLFGFVALNELQLNPIWILLGVNLVLLLLHLGLAFRSKRGVRADAQAAEGAVQDAVEARALPRGSLLALVAGFAATKALTLGWEPNLAWWSGHELGLSSLASGMTFILLGVAFTAGAVFPRSWMGVLGIPGFLFLESALRPDWSWAGSWWAALALIGLWYGAYVTLAVSRLGWNRPESIGRYNSSWMLVTDLPMAVLPVVLWQWRAPEPGMLRFFLGVFLALVSALGLFWAGRAPTRSSRA
ncbi:MAG: MFS transporter [Oligoflexia bacterium]|nr:MFS transporter [Oligoflexia bacterium]